MGERLQVLLYDIRQAIEDAVAFFHATGRPFGKSTFGGFHGFLHIGFVRIGNVGVNLTIERTDIIYIIA